jgi:hypothetical protein
MTSTVDISRKILERLCKMDYERKGGSSDERLIFPNIIPSKKEGKTFTEEKLQKYTRISEQELRFLFVEEFLKEPNNGYYYSVETPTEKKYRFGKNNEDIKIDITGRSVSIDMCVFTRDSDNKYNLFFNIEFKNENASKKSVSKDILKLMHEKENGAFILLLKNTGTLNNLAETRFGVIDKLVESFEDHKSKQVQWNGGNKKFIELIILSLEEKENGKGQPFILSRTISNCDLDTLDNSTVRWKKEVLVYGE